MYPELQDLPNGCGGSSGSRNSGVESPDYEPTDNEADADAAPLPPRPQVVSGPPAVPASHESPIVAIRRRLRHKQQDHATEAALQRIHDKLRNENELYKLHLKHYHMQLDQFKKRTSQLKILKDIYDLFEKVFKKCDSRSKLRDKPCRSKISGLRADACGDLIFGRPWRNQIQFLKNEESSEELSYTLFIILDGATNSISAYPFASTNENEARETLREFMHHYQVKPKRIVADSVFMTDKWKQFYATHDIQPIGLGPYTPWPNRAEASVRVFEKHIHQQVLDFKNDAIRKAASIRTLLREACWARNVSCTYGGKTPIALAFGRRPPDVVSLETATPGQLRRNRQQNRPLALGSYLRARQSEDIRNDLAGSLQFTSGPFNPGDKVCYYAIDENKLK